MCNNLLERFRVYNVEGNAQNKLVYASAGMKIGEETNCSDWSECNSKSAMNSMLI
jgi:hypothetical protein